MDGSFINWKYTFPTLYFLHRRTFIAFEQPNKIFRIVDNDTINHFTFFKPAYILKHIWEITILENKIIKFRALEILSMKRYSNKWTWLKMWTIQKYLRKQSMPEIQPYKHTIIKLIINKLEKMHFVIPKRHALNIQPLHVT